MSWKAFSCSCSPVSVAVWEPNIFPDSPLSLLLKFADESCAGISKLLEKLLHGCGWNGSKNLPGGGGIKGGGGGMKGLELGTRGGDIAGGEGGGYKKLLLLLFLFLFLDLEWSTPFNLSSLFWISKFFPRVSGAPFSKSLANLFLLLDFQHQKWKCL